MSQIQSRLIDLSFPTELFLEVIQHIPFNPRTVRTLALTHPRFRALLRKYERSITKNIARKQLIHALADFPCDEKAIGYVWYAQCVRQYDVVDDVMSVLVSHLNCYAVEKHNMAVTMAGLLLLYRLKHIDEYVDKLTFIKSLPLDPLTAMFLAVDYSCLTARYHGDGIINQRKYGRFLDANQLELRNEIEFCFAEGAMNLGPDFISDVLLHSEKGTAEKADITLLNIYHDQALHDWDTDTVEGEFMPPITQGPEQDPKTRLRSLFTTLLERLAELRGCSLEEVAGSTKSAVEAPNHSLAWIDLAEKARLIQGLDLESADNV